MEGMFLMKKKLIYKIVIDMIMTVLLLFFKGAADHRGFCP